MGGDLLERRAVSEGEGRAEHQVPGRGEELWHRVGEVDVAARGTVHIAGVCEGFGGLGSVVFVADCAAFSKILLVFCVVRLVDLFSRDWIGE